MVHRSAAGVHRGGAAALLHLGCGAGGHDSHFKKHFRVTGVDISDPMLTQARKTNPDVTYVRGDMRTVQLEERFDAVIIPDSIAYMVSRSDLEAAIGNAAGHLKPGGALLVVFHTGEDFRENNFVYTGYADGVHITVFENNHIVSGSTYEATLVYLIRQGGETDHTP